MKERETGGREIVEVMKARPTTDGDGVAISRVQGMQHAGMDPILMIDELRADRREDFIGGFPPHPHRGMQTLTYMKSGGIIHEDNAGNRGEIRGGGAQWMSAGRGIVHSEMPTRDSTGLHGFQLWVNLPGEEKMGEPRYRDVAVEELVRAAGKDYRATVISGDWDIGGQSLHGPLLELAQRASILDLELDPGGRLTVATDPGDSAIALVYSGSVVHGGGEVGAQQLLITSPGRYWELRAGGAGASLLLLRGAPIREPVAHYGPFVMNTLEEVEQAIADYRCGKFAGAAMQG